MMKCSLTPTSSRLPVIGWVALLGFGLTAFHGADTELAQTGNQLSPEVRAVSTIPRLIGANRSVRLDMDPPLQIWVAYFLFACASPWGWLSLVSPACILFLLLGVTGIPATEQQSLRSKGDAYRRYQERTSAFVPLPPRKQQHLTSSRP